MSFWGYARRVHVCEMSKLWRSSARVQEVMRGPRGQRISLRSSRLVSRAMVYEMSERVVLVVKAGRKLRCSRPIAVALTCGFHGGMMEELDPKRSCSETAELEVLFVDALPIIGRQLKDSLLD